MEISSSNPLNIQLASFARTLEWKLKKQNEEKQSEYMKITQLCKTKGNPMTVTNLYYSGQIVGSTCTECHQSCTSIFQKSFSTPTLKDLLHRKCNRNVKDVVPKEQEVQLFHQCSARSTLTYYFMRAASWVMYHTFSFLYKGVLIHPQYIESIKQAQDTGSSILFFISTPNPDIWTLCSVYFALYYSGQRPPEIYGFENLSWFSRLLFSRLGCLQHGRDPASIITHSVSPFYSDYVNYTIDDIYIVPVTVAFDQFIHVNFATPYALSELEIKYNSAELEDENDVDDVRDIDHHIKTDCFLSLPVTAICFVAHVIIANRTGNVISQDTLYQSAQEMRAELIRDRVSLNFKGETEHIVQYALKLLSPYLTTQTTSEGTLFVVNNMNQLVHYSMGLINKKLLLCIVIAVVYSFVAGVRITCSDDGKIEFNLHDDQEVIDDAMPKKDTVKHADVLSKSLNVLKLVETKLKVQLLKYCQNRKDKINQTIGQLTDWEILLSTDKALLEEERWCRNIVRSLEMDDDADGGIEIVDNRSYHVEALRKSPVAKSYINIASSLNHV